MKSEILVSPTPEQFGLTDKRVGYFKKATGNNSFLLTILIAVVFNISFCFYLFDFVLPHANLPFLLLLFLSVYPGFLVGKWTGGLRISKGEKSPDYRNYLDYCNALKSYSKLSRKIRREEFRKRKTKQYEVASLQEWWKGLDGRDFELAVATVLLNKGYAVRHTGSRYGCFVLNDTLYTRFNWSSGGIADNSVAEVLSVIRPVIC